MNTKSVEPQPTVTVVETKPIDTVVHYVDIPTNVVPDTITPLTDLL